MNFQPVENSFRAVWILAHSRLKAATLVVIILYGMGAFHFLGQIVHGLSKRKPKFRTSTFLSRNRVYHLHKSVPLTEKRPRKPETGIKDRFEKLEHEFLFGIFRTEQQDYIFRCFVAPGNFTLERSVNSCSMCILVNGRRPMFRRFCLFSV